MENLRSKVAEHLACAVCLEQFQNPKVLPCLHSYCHDCIMKLEKTNDNIACPECRIQVKVGNPPDISFLPSNFFINNLLATVSLNSDSDVKIMCENCESTDSAQARCQQCSRYLCEFCINAHKRFRDTKGHDIKNLDELKESGPSVMAKIMYCSKHEDEIVKLYCTTCQETICRDCTIIDHREHKVLFVRDVVEEKIAELKELLDEVKERKAETSVIIEEVKKVEQNLAAQTESVITGINQYFENIILKFQTRRDRFIEEANKLKVSKLKQIYAQREELEMKLTSFQSSIEFTEQAFENGSHVELLNMKRYITDSLKCLKDKESVGRPCTDHHIEFITGSTEDEIVEEGLLFCSVVGKKHDQELYDNCKASFETKQKNLRPEEKADLRISLPNVFGQEKANTKLLFSGVALKDVTVSETASHIFYNYVVSFVPLEFGNFRCNFCVNGRRHTTLAKNVTWDWEDDSPDNNRYISDCIFVSGVQSWEIKLDHKSCSECRNGKSQFTVGVVDEGDLVGLTGFVRTECVIAVNLDMPRKVMKITPSWSKMSSHVRIESSKVCPSVDIYDIACKCKVMIIAMGPNSFRRNTLVKTLSDG